MADQDTQPFGFLPKITTRGDIAAAALGLAVGYFADSILMKPLAIEPRAASIYTAAALVGLKNGIQAFLESRHSGKTERISDDGARGPDEVAKTMIKILRHFREKSPKNDVGLVDDIAMASTLIETIETQLDLWQLGLVEDGEFIRVLRQVAQQPAFRVARGREGRAVA